MIPADTAYLSPNSSASIIAIVAPIAVFNVLTPINLLIQSPPILLFIILG